MLLPGLLPCIRIHASHLQVVKQVACDFCQPELWPLTPNLSSQGTAEEYMLNLDCISPDASAVTPGAAGILPHAASPTSIVPILYTPSSTEVEGRASPDHLAAPMQGSGFGERLEQMEGRQVPQEPGMLQDAMLVSQAAGPLPVPETRPLQGLSEATATAASLQQQTGPVSAGEAQRASEVQGLFQQKGGSPSSSPGPGRLGVVSPAGTPGGAGGVVNAAQGRERTEAAKRGTRNSLLLSLHRVAVTDLPEFQDLPIDEQRLLDMTAEPVTGHAPLAEA